MELMNFQLGPIQTFPNILGFLLSHLKVEK